MSIKKWNARLSLLAVALLLIHSAYQTYAYITFYYNPLLSAATGYALAGIFVLHGILSVVSVYILHDSKTVAYKKLNIRTLLQRISAALMILLLPLHILSFGLLSGSAGTVWYIFVEAAQILFYAAMFTHVALSFTSALITLGRLEDMEKKRVIDRALAALCAVMFITTSVTITLTHTKMFN